MFTEIAIETITACNHRCLYCPNSKFDRGAIKNKKLMEDKLFFKIIDELAELGFKGELKPHGYGEPLLDHRLPELISYAKTNLPEVKILLYSNGDFLNIDKYNELVQSGVRHFIITQHGTERSTGLDEVIDYRNHYKPQDVDFTLTKFEQNMTLLNRGGLIDRQPSFKLKICFEPTKAVAVDYQGKVVLCCNDYLGTVVLGTLKNQRLIDIWESKRYKEIRKELRRGLFNYDICKKCSGIIETNRNTNERSFVQLDSDQLKKIKDFIEATRENTYSEPLSQTSTLPMKQLINQIKTKLPGTIQGKILDVGCGQGHMLEIFKTEGHSPVGITLNKEDIIECAKKGFTVYEMDQSFLEFEDEEYDFLWCRHYLIRSIFPAYTLAEFFRVIKPGGYCYIEVPDADSSINHENNRNNFSVLGKKMWSELIMRTGFTTKGTIHLEGKVTSGLNDAYWGFMLERPSHTVYC